MQDQDIPAVNFGLTFPSRVVRLDVLPVNLDAPTNTTFAGVKILGLFLFSSDLTIRNAYIVDAGIPRSINGDNETLYTFPWDGTFNDGTQAPDGEYRLGLRALRILAKNLNDPNNWETFVSSPFTVKTSKDGNQ